MYKYLISLLFLGISCGTIFAGQDQSAKINIGVPLGPVEVSKQLPIAINEKIALGIALAIPLVYFTYPYIKFVCSSYENRYKKAQKLLAKMRTKYEHCKYWQEASKRFMQQIEVDRSLIKKYADGLHQDTYEHILLAAELRDLDGYIEEHQQRLLIHHPELGERSFWDRFNFPIKFHMPRIQVRM